MSKMVECAKVNPATGCSHIIRGETDDEVLALAARHARQDHNMEATPELMSQVKANIETR